MAEGLVEVGRRIVVGDMWGVVDVGFGEIGFRIEEWEARVQIWGCGVWSCGLRDAVEG